MLQRIIRSRLKNERGEGTYIAIIIFTAVAMITIAVMSSVMSVVMTKSRLDMAVDQIVRQIQLAGKTDADTADLEVFLANNIAADDVDITITSTFITRDGCTTCIQLGTPFYITANAKVHLGGFWIFENYPIEMTANAAGVSERYWK